MKLKMARYILSILLFVFALTVNAQNDRQLIREGNRMFNKQQYDKAEIQYRKAVSKNPSNPQAVYNLGCALMMQNKDSAAIVQYEKAAKLEKNKFRLASAYHNIGVICQNHKMYGDAIKAYEQALRNNPKDDETRYNLALCKKLQKNDKKDNTKKKQDKKNENNDSQKNKDKNNDNNKGENKQQQPKEQMSKENAEQLLNAAIQNEKATQQRLKKAMQKPGQRRRSEKNW